MYDVITIGSATRDVFLRSQALHTHPAKDALSEIEACFPFGAKIDVEEIIFETGGGATNSAVTFSRMGKLKTAALTRVGADSAGRDIVEVLKKEKVDTDLVQRAAREFTAYSTILLSGVGERTILVYRGASRAIPEEKIPWTSLSAGWFYVSALGGNLRLLSKIIGHARGIGAKIAFNPGGGELSQNQVALEQIFNRLDWLNLNREEAARLTAESWRDLKGIFKAVVRFAPNILITDGSKGAYALTGGKIFFAPTLKTKPLNVTGAGDAFGSGFITGLIKKNDPIYGLKLGTLNADAVIRQMGAKVGIRRHLPNEAELRRARVIQKSYV